MNPPNELEQTAESILPGTEKQPGPFLLSVPVEPTFPSRIKENEMREF